MANSAPSATVNSRTDISVAWTLLALLTVTAACFWPALSGPFVFDDFPNLQYLRHLGGQLTPTSIGNYLSALNGLPSRPLAALSFLIEDSTWPAYPRDFKRNNLLFHLLVGVLVFVLARSLAKQANVPSRRSEWLALACAAMWMLQPMQLSATMLVVQRMNILSSGLVLAGLLGYIRIVSCEARPPLWRVAAAGATLSLFGLLAFLFKENGLLIFAYAAAINFTLLHERILRYPPLSRRILLIGTLTPLIALLIAAMIYPSYILDPYASRDFTLGERLLTQPRVLFDYLSGILFPRIGGQGVFHDGYVVSRSLWNPATTLPALLGLGALLTSAVLLRRRVPVYGFAVLWFLGGHLMESSFVGLELYFEHRNYLPMIGPLFALAYLAFSIARSHQAIPALLVWIAICGALTAYNAGTWGDRGKISLVWLSENPRSARAVQMAAGYYHDLGNYPAARNVLDDGIARMPAQDELRIQRVLLDCVNVGVTEQQWQNVEALAGHSKNSKVLPEVIAALRNQVEGPACHGSLRPEQLRQMVNKLLENPSISVHHPTMAFLHYEMAKLAEHERDLDLTMHHLNQAFNHRPSPFIPREQALHLLTAGLPREALDYLDRSDNTPLPGLKAWLLDVPALNAGLRQSAHEMIRAHEEIPHGSSSASAEL